MSMRVLRKALGLLIVDFVIIIGIFVLQFRTDSNIIEKIGNLQVTFTKSEVDNEEIVLKNFMKASYNGINIYFDDQNPAKVLFKGDDEKKNTKIINWSNKDSIITLEFSDNLFVTLEVANENTDSPLYIRANLPAEIKNFYLPYSFAYNMNIQKDEGKKVVLNDKNATWSFSTEQVDSGYIVFSHKDTYANYSIYDDTIKFTFDALTELAAAEKSNYLNVITNYKNNLISSFKATLSDNNFSEQAVVSYVAAMAEAGKYQQAVDDIPQSYKRSEQRTYLSAPYFNNLVNMNNILEQDIKDTNALITKATYTDSLDIYTIRNLAAYLCIHQNSSEVQTILNKAVNADFDNCSISQITGIILAYDDLFTMNKKYASVLKPAIKNCIEKLTNACTFENEILTISENDNFLSVMQGVETGIALIRLGEIENNEVLTKAGRVIVSSYISETSSFDYRTLANLYPVIAYNNWYYPHFKFMYTENNSLIWAWTCARDVKYEKDEEGSMNLSIDFPQGLTHYVIFKGIPEFASIYIYNTLFRTDPRFETYNSSGYVYKAASNTLLLKSRHKSEIENVKMAYKKAVSTKTTEAKQTTSAKTETKSEATEKKADTTQAASTSENTNTPLSSTSNEKPATANAEKTANTNSATEKPSSEIKA